MVPRLRNIVEEGAERIEELEDRRGAVTCHPLDRTQQCYLLH